MGSVVARCRRDTDAWAIRWTKIVKKLILIPMIKAEASMLMTVCEHFKATTDAKVFVPYKKYSRDAD